MREYDQVFVYKQLFKTKKDASTQTNEGRSSLLRVGVAVELIGRVFKRHYSRIPLLNRS